MTERQAIWKSILHWRRMIKWVEKQDGEEAVNTYYMLDELGEGPRTIYCALCQKFYYTDLVLDQFSGHCRACPLCEKFGSCTDNRTGNENAYPRPSKSWQRRYDWDEWLKSARRLLEQLESLRKPK